MAVAELVRPALDSRCTALSRWQTVDLPKIFAEKELEPEKNLPISLLAGNSNRPLAEKIGRLLGLEVQFPASRFPDEEIGIDIDESVRGSHVFIIQSAARPDVNGFHQEACMMADAARRCSAARITGVFPYLPYQRSERMNGKRSSIGAALVVNQLEEAGIGDFISIDIHAPAVQGVTKKPWDDFSSDFVLVPHLREIIDPESTVVLAPDWGASKRNGRVRQRLGITRPLASAEKERVGKKLEVKGIEGDVMGHDILIVDDILGTFGTINEVAEAAYRAGANEGMVIAATHPVLVPPAVDRINKSDLIKQVLVTDSLELMPDALGCRKITQVSADTLLAEAMIRIHKNLSISSLYG